MTNEQLIKKGNIKLTVFEEMPYEDYKKACDAICALGYDCIVVDNGTAVFQKKEIDKRNLINSVKKQTQNIKTMNAMLNKVK